MHCNSPVSVPQVPWLMFVPQWVWTPFSNRKEQQTSCAGWLIALIPTFMRLERRTVMGSRPAWVTRWNPVYKMAQCLTLTLEKHFLLFLIILCAWVFCLRDSVQHTSAWCPRRPEQQSPWNWTIYRCLWATVWVPGIEPGPLQEQQVILMAEPP